MLFKKFDLVKGNKINSTQDESLLVSIFDPNFVKWKWKLVHKPLIIDKNQELSGIEKEQACYDGFKSMIFQWYQWYTSIFLYHLRKQQNIQKNVLTYLIIPQQPSMKLQLASFIYT